MSDVRTLEDDAMIYWTTSLYIADAKRLAIYLTREDIDQIRANAMHLNGSPHASVRRCAGRLPVVIVNAPLREG